MRRVELIVTMQALAVLDMQRWMFHSSERAERTAQLPTLVPAIGKLAARFAVAGLPVFDVRVFHKKDRSTWSRLMLKYDVACLIEGTADVELVDGLHMPASARLVPKRANSAFLGTDFAEQLQRQQVETLVLAGAFIDGCVALTAADAAQRGFEVVIVEDAVAHCDQRHRTVMLEWLVAMYELEVTKADALRIAS
jgi:nicotinamidase-related amidase